MRIWFPHFGTFEFHPIDTVTKGVVKLTNKPKFKEIADKIYVIAINAIRILAAGLLFLSSSTIFGFGFISAIFFPERMESTLQRINEIWKRQVIWIQALIAFGCFLAWPVAMVAAAYFTGAWTCLKLQEGMIINQPPEPHAVRVS